MAYEEGLFIAVFGLSYFCFKKQKNKVQVF